MAVTLLVPKFTSPAFTPVQGAERAITGFLVGADLNPAGFPIALATAAQFETSPIYVQGYDQFQGWISATGTGTLRIEYGICHPTTFVVIGYRQMFAGATPGPAMIATFGRNGQSVPAFQGDLFTAFTVRLTAVTLNVNINDLALWAAG